MDTLILKGDKCMNKVLRNQIIRLEKREAKIMNQRENPLIKKNITPIMNTVEEKIPEKLRETLNNAFYKGFLLVFEKGNKYIEKLYSKEKKQLQYDLNNYAVDRALSKKHIHFLDKEAKRSRRINSTISLLEGTALGFLGIGLPDIPLFISVIMKTIYEITLSYGYDYEKEEEKIYILLLICIAMSKEEERKKYNAILEEVEGKLDQSIEVSIDLKSQMKVTSDVLSDALITAKFIQGLPIVGVVGGIVNQSIIRKIGNVAEIKYKKRYLLQKSKKV